MDCRLTARHVKVTDELRDLVARRLTPLERLLGDTVVSPDMVLSSERNHYQTEFVVHARGDHRLHGVGDGNSWQVAVGGAVDKVMHQAQTLKGKWQARHRRSESMPEEGSDLAAAPDETTHGD